jgi:elongin-A
MGVISLYALAKRACIKNISSITDIGDIPYEHIRPILVRVENPQQLRNLEKTSPHLLSSTHELWAEIIKRGVENGAQKLERELEENNRRPSYKLWQKLCREDKEAIELLSAKMLEDQRKTKDAAASRTIQVVDAKTLPKLPRASGMRVEKNRNGRPIQRSGDTSTLSFTSGSKTKATTGAGVISKAKREARQMSLFSAQKSVLATPTHKLGQKASHVGSVPKGLVEQHKVGQLEIKKTTVMVPKSGPGGVLSTPASASTPRVSTPQPQPPGGYKIPRLGGVADPNRTNDLKRRVGRSPASDPFMPAKKRRLS